MWNNRYYTLKDMVVTLVTLITMFSVASVNYNIVKKENVELKSITKEQQAIVNKYDAIPEWLFDAYSLCNSDDVPEEFKTECMICEIELKNKMVKVQPGT